MYNISSDSFSMFKSIYSNIENEIVTLSNYVKFDKKNELCFSFKIAKLIMRIVSEIENVLYEICLSDGTIKIGDQPSLNKLIEIMDKEYLMSRKEVKVKIGYFGEIFKERSIFLPFDKTKIEPENKNRYYWSNINNKLKHNRSSILSDANLKTLLDVYAGLYLVHVYLNFKYFSSNSFSDHVYEHDIQCENQLFNKQLFAKFEKKDFPIFDYEELEKSLSEYRFFSLSSLVLFEFDGLKKDLTQSQYKNLDKEFPYIEKINEFKNIYKTMSPEEKGLNGMLDEILEIDYQDFNQIQKSISQISTFTYDDLVYNGDDDPYLEESKMSFSTLIKRSNYEINPEDLFYKESNDLIF
jgi:hypothetical protein